jgi:uncharacterized protein (DUF58 family)
LHLFKRLIPSRALLLIVGAWLGFALALLWLPAWTRAWKGCGWSLLIIAAADALASLRPFPLEATRSLAGTLPLGVWSDVKLRVRNLGRSRVHMEVFDHAPPFLTFRGMPRKVKIHGAGWSELHYRVRPTRRGLHTFERIQVRVASPLGLWRSNLFLGESSSVRVFPNFAAVAHYALLATDQRLSQMGILKKRRRGEGMEFHQLREYRQGDSLRQIDWKATSRIRKLISREYQDERDQQVFFLIDSGRRMRAQDGDLSHFDHALNAVLLLSHVALRQGDAVGFLSFSGMDRFLAPRKSPSALRQMLNTLYDLEPSTEASDYEAAAQRCFARVKKRSLVVLVTNLRDEDDESLLPALRLLQRRHLVMVASLREAILGQALEPPIRNFQDALRVGSTHDYLGHRRQTFEALHARGAVCLDVEPQKLAVSLVNRYLDVKRSGRL